MTYTNDWSAKVPPRWVMIHSMCVAMRVRAWTFDLGGRGVFTGIDGLEVSDQIL